MKYSKQREMILNCIKSNPVHPTADMIYDVLKKEHPNLSLGTVYRNLNQLTEHGYIKKVAIPGYADRFDGTLHDHYHFLCLECHQVTDLTVTQLDELKNALQLAYGIEIVNTELSFKGICSACKTSGIH